MVMDVKSNNKGLSKKNDKNKKIIKELENTANNQALFFRIITNILEKKQLEEILQKFVFFFLIKMQVNHNDRNNDSSKNNRL